MRYISLFFGIEAASVAWEGLGWQPLAFAEVDKFPSAVLAHRFPDVPNLGDVTKIKGEEYHGMADLVVGGSPCQGFSVAGKLEGLQDARSGLAFEYVRLLGEIRPRWIVWENVPGVFSTGGGRDFPAFLAALYDRGYRDLAWRVLDAQHFGVPQRRRRVFLVGHLGDGARAAQVLFDPEGVRRDHPTREKEASDYPRLAGTLSGSGAGTARTAGIKNELSFCIPVTFAIAENIIGRQDHTGGNGPGFTEELMYTLNTSGVHGIAREGLGVRRLTPRECERLQGFPDDWTNIEGATDLARYRALGNSMAVPVMRWIGEQIRKVEERNP